jgi:1,4-alpha-glucan branching enzyme
VVVANLLNEPQDGYVIGFPAVGTWTLRFNSDWRGYSQDFQDHPSGNLVAEPGEYDGLPFHAALSLGPYSVLIYSQ